MNADRGSMDAGDCYMNAATCGMGGPGICLKAAEMKYERR